MLSKTVYHSYFLGLTWVLVVVTLLIARTAGAQQPLSYTIDTFAGHDASETLDWPSGIAVDGTGAVYIADTGNHRVLKAETDGTITTVAGTGTAGYSGDGGLATAAQLRWPTGMAVAGDGTVYIADTNNHCVRAVVPDGTITTFAGMGSPGLSGDGGPATAAQLSLPYGLAVAGDGTVYIADTNSHRVRKVAITDGTITTVAGMGSNGFGGGYSGDDGPATAAQLHWPYDVAVDDAGAVYIADELNHRVRAVAPDGTITTFAGTGTSGSSGDGGPATEAQLHQPFGVAVASDGTVYITDLLNHNMRAVAPDGTITTIAGRAEVPGFSGDAGPSTAAYLNTPTGVAVASDGTVYIADSSNNRVRKLTPPHAEAPE